MSAADIVAAVSAIVAAVREAPQLVLAVKGVFEALETGNDPTPAVKHLEAVAAAKELGIDYP